MNIGFLNTFLVVAEAESFTRAARELGITQPAVSQHIRALERTYRVRLFQRHAQKIRLTPEGEALRQRARDFFRSLNELQNCMENINDLRQGCMTLAINVFLIQPVAPLVMQFKRLYPGVQIRLYCHNSRKIIRMLAHGDVDVALGGSVAGESGALDSLPLHSVPFSLVVRAGHPLAGRPEVVPADLAHTVFVVRESGTHIREQVMAWFGDTPLPDALVETNSLEGTHQLVRGGAAAFLPVWLVADEVQAGRLVAVSCRGLPTRLEYSLFAQHRHPLSLACRTFLRFLAKEGDVSDPAALLEFIDRHT